MRILTTAIIALFISTAFMACKKDSDKPEKSTVGAEGLYTGKYGFDSETPHIDYSLNLKVGGIIEEIGQSSGNAVGRGTWKLNGNQLTASYTMLFEPFSDYFLVATFDPSAKTLTGTWGFESNGTDGGKFIMATK
jgi:hypothetical protein